MKTPIILTPENDEDPTWCDGCRSERYGSIVRVGSYNHRHAQLCRYCVEEALRAFDDGKPEEPVERDIGIMYQQQYSKWQPFPDLPRCEAPCPDGSPDRCHLFAGHRGSHHAMTNWDPKMSLGDLKTWEDKNPA